MSLSTIEQVAAARRAALSVTEPDLTAFVVTGKDRLSWLNGMLTCELATRQPGDAVYGLAVTQKGRIAADVVVIVAVDRVLVLAQRRVAESLAATFERHMMMEDAELTLVADLRILSIHGPRSGDVLEAARVAGAWGGRLDRTGLGGVILAVPSALETAVVAAVEGVLARVGGASGDDAGWETLRLERGVPLFGVDFDEAMYPQEASLEDRAVSFSKGCYLGQEVVCMLQMRGHVNRKLVSLVVDGDSVPSRGTPVRVEVSDEGGAAVGDVTSASFSPTLGKVVALARIKHAFAQPGRSLRVDARPAQVVAIPA